MHIIMHRMFKIRQIDKSHSSSILSHLTSKNICSQCFAALAWGAQILFIGRHLTPISIWSLESFMPDLAAHQILVNQCTLQSVTFPSFSLNFLLHTANSMLDNKLVKNDPEQWSYKSFLRRNEAFTTILHSTSSQPRVCVQDLGLESLRGIRVSQSLPVARNNKRGVDIFLRPRGPLIYAFNVCAFFLPSFHQS